VAVMMHCNLRPPDAAPVVVRCNYDAHTNVGSTYLFLSYSIL